MFVQHEESTLQTLAEYVLHSEGVINFIYLGSTTISFKKDILFA